MLLKVGTPARITRPGFGAVGTITRVMTGPGMYRVDNGSSFWHAKAAQVEAI
ncbi:hypothetical protein [Streptomyces sp. NBC_01751]|uniref:hypothetical protein n=1 Tax=Streptomyces sp. NBC_01751 TaxID=2975929 RepID=UPI002DD7AC2C|nr:hypothetical protein [Streptomyces sp. NBC_01751]WSD23368.1 hypothetical protein OHA26_07690 [Streptomyces sp. NBC_01751]